MFSPRKVGRKEKDFVLYCVKNHCIGVSMDDLVNYEKTDRENLGLEVPPKGKHVFGMVKVGDKGQIVIPANARKIFDIQPGDNLLILGDEEQGIAILKEKSFLEHLRLMERLRHMGAGE